MKPHDSVPLTVKIMGREYQVACPKEERDLLLASARYLDDRMVAIRRRSAGLGIERIAVMAALNMAREMNQANQAGQSSESALTESVDFALDDNLDEVDEDRAHQLQLRIDAELEAD